MKLMRSMKPVRSTRGGRGAAPPRPLLAVGGWDPSGGAGIAADLRVAAAAGVPALGVLAGLTAQSSVGVRAVSSVPRGWVRAQLEALASENVFGAVKTGLLVSAASIAELTAWYAREGSGPLVVDPVLVSGDGRVLFDASARRALVARLFPLATLVTPNREEAEALSGLRLTGPASVERAARLIAGLGPRAVFIKGGHAAGPPADLLWDGRKARWMRGSRRMPGRWHGLGCHIASAIAARLALGDSLPRAVVAARALLAAGMRSARVTPSGRRVPHWGRGA
jgi:hydroxymethylpyrimidine/phosphomethylpyrimidine kinase